MIPRDLRLAGSDASAGNDVSAGSDAMAEADVGVGPESGARGALMKEGAFFSGEGTS